MNSSSNLNNLVQNWLVKQLADQLSLDAKTINVTEPLTRYGLDSIDAVTMVGDLEDWVGQELPSTLFWDHSTIEKASLFLVENYDLSNLSGEETQRLEFIRSSLILGVGWVRRRQFMLGKII